MRRRIARRVAGASVAVALMAAPTACADAGDDGGSISYWLWDSNQLPAYQACARAFEKKNPDIQVEVEQHGWDDYWGQLTTGMVSGDAPDVFTNHVSQYPTFVNKKQILPIDDLVERDDVDTGIYQPGLTELWVGPDGKRYGLPKDWDTTAVFYNEKMAEEAGLSPADLADLSWNPEDGGTYEKAIARLTVDKNGKRGDEPGFDPKKVEVYGLGLENAGAGIGQTQWAMYAFATGWKPTKEPWADEYHYDDPRFQKTIAWWRSLIKKGYMPSLEVATSGVSVSDGYGAGKYAMSTNGSWMIKSYFGHKGVETGVAPTPKGPDGKRASMFNGLSDAIYSGTDNKEAAWQWVKYLASSACQKRVAQEGVVFPAVSEAVPAAERKFAEQGVDISAFTEHVESGTTHLYPITDHAADIEGVMKSAMDSVVGFRSRPSSLSKANEKVNKIMGN